MSSLAKERLYSLLPSIHRLRDAEQDQALRALLLIIEEQLRAIEADIQQLYENSFIETCDEWVVPYIGDLLGIRGLPAGSPTGFSQRALVAKTLGYRRRKGTSSMLEQLGHDSTDRAVRVIEFLELMSWTQNLNHLRLNTGTVDLRNIDDLDQLGGPFDRISHNSDVRPILGSEGWYLMTNIGFFLWQLRSYPLREVTPRKALPDHPYGYHFSTIGHPTPLFCTTVRGLLEANLPNEVFFPNPIRPIGFFFDLKNYRESYPAAGPEAPPNSNYYGPERSLNIIKDGVSIPPGQVVYRDLRSWERPPAGKIAVDVRLGRLTFLEGEEPQASLEASYCYGFSADMGGGPYDRRRYEPDVNQADFEPDTTANPTILGKVISVRNGEPISGAINKWIEEGRLPTVIQVEDSRTYERENPLSIDVKAGTLVIQAANGKRPTLIADMEIEGNDSGSQLAVNGFLIQGSLSVTQTLGKLRIEHSTLIPGHSLDEDGNPNEPDRPSITTTGAGDHLQLEIDHSITGALRLPRDIKGLTVRDSIIDSTSGSSVPAIAASDDAALPGPMTTLERCTLFGSAFVKEFTLCSDVIFTRAARAERLQAGCVRFSYLPSGSQMPRGYRCQPDSALAGVENPSAREVILARLRPKFISERYGEPSYAQLSPDSPLEILRGASDGSEMGGYSQLMQPQRESNLRARIEESLPVGLEAGIIPITVGSGY